MYSGKYIKYKIYAVFLVSLILSTAFVSPWLMIALLLCLFGFVMLPFMRHGATPKMLFHRMAQAEIELRALKEENAKLQLRVENNIDLTIAALSSRHLELNKTSAMVHDSLIAIEQNLGDGFSIIEGQSTHAKKANVVSLGPKSVLNVFTTLASQVDVLRCRLHSFLPPKREHIGAVISCDELLMVVKKAMSRFARDSHREFNMTTKLSGLPPSTLLFHDIDFILRLLYFLCSFAGAEQNPGQAKPRVSFTISPVSKNRCVSRVILTLTGKNVLPKNFDRLYLDYFWSNVLPQGLVNFNQDIVDALKLSACYSVVVNTTVDDCGNTTMVFERVTYYSSEYHFFKHALEMRKSIPPADVFFVADDDTLNAKKIDNFFVKNTDYDFFNMPSNQFTVGVLCRASCVILSDHLSEAEKAMIYSMVLSGPLFRIRIIQIGAVPEAYRKNERVMQLASGFDTDELFDMCL